MTGQPFFLPAGHGQRFCIYHPPAPDADRRGAIVYVHPFAEEMNKSRALAARHARLCAAAGWAVLQIDLAGSGDSSGDFAAATWADWGQDVRLAAAWLRQRHPGPLWLWGLRAGCLVAVAARLDEPVNFLFWQPVISGKQHLQQFLRLKIAGELLGGDPRAVAEDLKLRMARRETVEIAGYGLSPALAEGLAEAALVPPATGGRVVWLEVAAKEGADLSPAAARQIALWRDAGWSVAAAAVPGPAFWQTVEIEEAPALLAASLDLLAEADRGS